jgi:hypothetical protein
VTARELLGDFAVAAALLDGEPVWLLDPGHHLRPSWYTGAEADVREYVSAGCGTVWQPEWVLRAVTLAGIVDPAP